jgi:hypothetical protein
MLARFDQREQLTAFDGQTGASYGFGTLPRDGFDARRPLRTAYSFEQEVMPSIETSAAA